MNPRVSAVKYKPHYKLVLTFTNEEEKEFDMAPYLSYPVYEPLKDESFCTRAKTFNGTVVWNDVIDFDPDTLYIESKPLLSESFL